MIRVRQRMCSALKKNAPEGNKREQLPLKVEKGGPFLFELVAEDHVYLLMKISAKDDSGIPEDVLTVLLCLKCFLGWQSLSQLLISCAYIVLSLMSIYPTLVHKLSLLFCHFKIKAPDTRSHPT